MPNRQQILQFLAALFNGAVWGAVLWLLLGIMGIPAIVGSHGPDPFLVALGAGALLTVCRLGKLLRAGIIVAVLLIIAISYTSIMRPALNSLVRKDSVSGTYDAVVALSAGANADGYLNGQGTDRLLTALDLIERDVSKNLVITRFRSRFGSRVVTPEKDQQWLIGLAGEHPAKVFTAKDVVNTHDEALRVRELAKANKWQRIAVVTSPAHTRRACATFERAGLKVTCVPSRSTDVATKSVSTAGDRLGAFGLWLYERIGYLEYWRRGWV